MENDIVHMQRQAARRVQQMQEHSRQVMEQYEDMPSISSPGQRRWPGDTPVRLASPGLYSRALKPTEPAPEESSTEYTALDETTVDGVELFRQLDDEQWFLLGLTLLLFRSGCRPELTLALLYLAM